MYTAAVLCPNSSALLRWMARAILRLEEKGYAFKTPHGEPLPHHMTINLGALDETLNPATWMGADVLLSVEELVYEEELGVCAAPVLLAVGNSGRHDGEELRSKNVHPHITVCLKSGVKPFTSNLMLEHPEPKKTTRVKLDTTYHLDARVELCG